MWIDLLFITARKRSLRILCFYTRLSVTGGGGWQGVCMAGGMCCGWGSMHVRGGMWGREVCMGGMHGRLHAWQGDVRDRGDMCGRGHAWWGGGGRRACVPGEGVHAILRDALNERTVRILLECILVFRITPWRSRSSWSDRGDTPRNRCSVEPWRNRSTPPCPTSRWHICSNSSRRCRNHVTLTIPSGSVNIHSRPTSRTLDADADASVGNVDKIMWCKDYYVRSRLQRASGYNEILSQNHWHQC